MILHIGTNKMTDLDRINNNIVVGDEEDAASGINGAIFGLNINNSVANIQKVNFQTVAGMINAENNSYSTLINNDSTDIFTQNNKNSYIQNDIEFNGKIENVGINNALYNFDNFSGDLQYVYTDNIVSTFTGVGFQPINNTLSSNMTSLLANDGTKYFFTQLYNGLFLDDITLQLCTYQLNKKVSGTISGILSGNVEKTYISSDAASITGMVNGNLNGIFKNLINTPESENNIIDVTGLINSYKISNIIFENSNELDTNVILNRNGQWYFRRNY